jgi:hypothetical protein
VLGVAYLYFVEQEHFGVAPMGEQLGEPVGGRGVAGIREPPDDDHDNVTKDSPGDAAQLIFLIVDSFTRLVILGADLEEQTRARR